MTTCARPDCSRQFEPKRGNQIYCSPEHRNRAGSKRPAVGSNRTSVLWASQNDDRSALYRALRQRLATALDRVDTHPRDLSPLTRELREVDNRLAELEHHSPAPGGIDAAAATPDAPLGVA